MAAPNPLPVTLPDDLWVCNIFPLLGMGHYAFVGTVDKRFNRLYKKYCEQQKNAPYIIPDDPGWVREVGVTDTFYSNTFNCIPLASIWYNDPSVDKFRVCDIIAKVGSIQVLSWAHFVLGYPWDQHTTASAAMGGNIQVLDFLRAQGCPISRMAATEAARQGEVEILQYLIKHGSVVWQNTCVYEATCGGHVSILRLLHANGCSFSVRSCAHAAETGQLSVLKWLHSIGCPWDDSICSRAAAAGHLELLQWARSHGCPWNEGTIRAAISFDHFHIAKWAEDNGCPLPPTYN